MSVDPDTAWILIVVTYFAVAVLLAAWIIWLGTTGRWSKDDWPLFLPIAVMWPWILVLAPIAWAIDAEEKWWRRRRERKAREAKEETPPTPTDSEARER